MANCAGIFQGEAVSCDDPLSIGIEQKLYLANLEDVATIGYSVTVGSENVIESIVMKSTKAFFLFGGINESIKAQSELVRNSVSNTYKHQIDFLITQVDNTALLNMQAMAYVPQIAIVTGGADSSFGNGAIQVYGVNSGMQLLSNIRINGDIETGGAHSLQLASPESGSAEGSLPDPFFLTDYATSIALVEALLTPAV